MVITKYYKSLKNWKEKAQFREKVMERCDMSYPCFMQRIARGKWTKLETEAIMKIIQEETGDAN